MPADSSGSFDLVVFGQISRDVLYAQGQQVVRVGGVAYAASVAARLGAQVGVLAGLTDPDGETVLRELAARGIDCSGVRFAPSEPLVYLIRNADEVVDQQTTRTGPSRASFPLPDEVPDAYRGASWALLYPVSVPTATRVALALKKDGTRIAVDLQHDIQSFADAEELLRQADLVLVSRPSLLAFAAASGTAEAVAALRQYTAAAVVVKMGLCGSSIFDAGGARHDVPAYLADFRYTVGAGDAYDAALIVRLLRGDSFAEAGDFAARAVAAVVEQADSDPSAVLAGPSAGEARDAVFLAPEDAAGILVYVAGHFHSEPLRDWITQMASAIERLGMRTFMPHRDVGVVGTGGVTSMQAYNADMSAIRRSHALVALLDGAVRGGTFFEMGVAAERGVPIFALRTDNTVALSNMVRSACDYIVPDVATIVRELLRRIAPYQRGT